MIKGIRYLKAEDLPIAGEDDEYPDWLWGLLDKEGGNSEAGKEGDLFCELDFLFSRVVFSTRV